MDDLSKFAAAFVAAQADMGHAPFDSNNPHFKSRFASLRSVLDTVRPVLAAKGIAVLQRVSGDAVETTLLHTSGQSISDSCPIVTDRAGPQALGSAITYARRYGLAAICGISADEDDDANGAEKPTGNQHAAPAEERKVGKPSKDLLPGHDRPAPRQDGGTAPNWHDPESAKYSGKCYECHTYFEAGETIQWGGGHDRRHIACAPDVTKLVKEVVEVFAEKEPWDRGDPGPSDDDLPFTSTPLKRG